MNVSFLKIDPLDSVIVDSADGRPLYEVKTPLKLSGKTTTIRRSNPSFTGQIVAQIHWHSLSSDKIHFMGTEMRMDDFLRKSGGIMSHSKILTGNDGRQYEWKHSSNEFWLRDSQTHSLVAQSHRKKIGFIFSQGRKMNLDIFPQGMHSMDVILLSFIIMESKRRERSEAAGEVAEAAGEAAGAAAGGGG